MVLQAFRGTNRSSPSPTADPSRQVMLILRDILPPVTDSLFHLNHACLRLLEDFAFRPRKERAGDTGTGGDQIAPDLRTSQAWMRLPHATLLLYP